MQSRIAIRVSGMRPFGRAKEASIGERDGTLNSAINAEGGEGCRQDVSLKYLWSPSFAFQRACSLMVSPALRAVCEGMPRLRWQEASDRQEILASSSLKPVLLVGSAQCVLLRVSAG